MELLTTSEMAKKWDISRRRVSTLCAQGRIEGAILKGNTWLIPENAEKPDDPRRVRKMDRISSRFSLGALLRKSMGGFVLWQHI